MTRVMVRAADRSFQTVGGVVWAVHGVDLTVDSGAFVGLHGVSGSGKSTLLNLLSGLDTADSGQITVADLEVEKLNEDERGRLRLEHVGVIFQDDNLIEEFTAVENVMLPLEVTGTGSASARNLAAESLARVGLSGLEDRLPSQMSGGQRQRVGIARALVGRRGLLLADEPTGALDSRTSRDLFTLLRSLSDGGVTVIVASHDPMIGEFADVLYEMSDGRLTLTRQLR